MQHTEDQPILLDVLDLILQDLAPPDGEWERLGHIAPGPKEDLRACSLVCRSWYGVSRRHIFRNVLYSFTPGELDSSWKMLETGRWRGVTRRDHRWSVWVDAEEPCKTLPSFVDFLQNHPERAAQIQRLTLRCWPHDIRVETNDNDNRVLVRRLYDRPAQLIPPSLLFTLLQALPQLHTLRLRDIFLQNADTNLTPELSDRPLISLKQLSISYPFAGTYRDHYEIPPLLPVLSRWVKTRSLQIVAQGLKTSRVDVGSILFDQLNTVVLDHVPCTTRLPRHLLGLNVRNLVVMLPGSTELAKYNGHFRDMGQNLRHLRVHGNNANVQDTLDISPCTNLESFAMDFPESLWQHPSATWRLIASVVSSMSGLQKLRDFKINLRMPPIEIYDDDIAALDPSGRCSTMNARLVSCVRMLRLPSLIVVYHTSPEARPDPWDWPRDFLKKIFNVAHEQNLLRIKQGKKGSSWLIDPNADRPLPWEAYHWM